MKISTLIRLTVVLPIVVFAPPLGAQETSDEDDVLDEWLTTIADSPNPGPVRDEIRSLASIA